MATVVNTLIQGLTEKMVQSRVDSADASGFLFGTYFPVKRVQGFQWKTLTNQLAKRNVAADLHTDNGSILRKQRPIYESARGDIPFISISREMKRNEIKEYQTALAFAQDEDATKLVQYWGKTSSDWANAASADILGDFRNEIKNAKARGLNPKFAFVNLDEFYKIASSEQIIKACASFASNALNISQTPDLTTVNSMLARQTWLNGIQLKVIDQTITREFTDGSQESGNPFEDCRCVLSETERLGTTQYDILTENENLILRAERAHTIIKKYGTIEPKSEVTIGQADAVPVFDTAYRNVYMRTDGKDWE